MIHPFQRQLRTRDWFEIEERRKALENLMGHRSALSFGVPFDDDALFAKLFFPEDIKGWDCEVRIEFEDDKAAGYYLFALARFDDYRAESLSIAGFFELDGSAKCIFRADAHCREDGGSEPAGRPEAVWRRDQPDTGVLFVEFVDAILAAKRRTERSLVR